jgi:hypothetical protein
VANADTGKEKLHEAAKEFGAILCTQLAYEEVMNNPKLYIIDEVSEGLRQKGFLPAAGGLYESQTQEEFDLIMGQIKNTIFHYDKVKERTTKLEGIFFGRAQALIGRRYASNPNRYKTEGGANLNRYLTAEGHIFEYKAWKPGQESLKGGKGIFTNPWDEQGGGMTGGWGDHITKYMGQVLNEGKDAGTPGIADLKILAGLYQEFWENENYVLFRKHFLAAGSNSNANAANKNKIDAGTHPGQEGGGLRGGFLGKYSKAFATWKQYVEALGYFSQECVDAEVPKIAAALGEALDVALVKLQAELERDNVKKAFMGPGFPPVDPVQNLRPFDFQCFLIENIVHLTDLRAPGTAGAPNYKNVSRLSTGNDPGTVLSRINHGGQTEQVRALMSLCPEAYALLEPSIKIYRVDYDKDNPTKPIREQELRIPNFIDETDIASMLGANGGRPTGYGLKSFNWSLAGVQPAEVDNNITANMKFYFQSIQDLFQGQLAAGQKDASPLDLIISSRASEIVRKNKTNKSITAKPANCGMLRNNIHEEYEGANFRISARVGWNMPPNFATAFPSFSEKVGTTTKGALLAQALRNTQMHLFLQQTRHLIDFKEDGSVELDIQYQAAISGILKEERANILANDKTFFEEEIEGYRKKIEAEKEKDYNFALGGGEGDVAAGEAKRDARIAELLEEIESLEVQDRNFKYKKFLEKLYTKNKIYNMAVQPAELLIPSWKDLTAKQRAARAKRRLSPNEAERGFLNIDMASTSANNTFDTTLLEAVTATSKDPTKEESELEQHSLNNAKRFKSFSLTSETIMIPYFYLGDLLDLILETLPGYDDGEKFLFFLSEVELLNPLLAFQVKNLAEVMCTDKLNDAKFIAALRNSDPLRFKNVTKLQNIINIGDIPISLDAFNVWFKDNVIKKDRDNYYFLYFVKDVCSQLVSNALRGDCFGNSLKFDIRFDAAKVELRKADAILPGKNVTVDDLAAQKAALSSQATSIKNVMPGLIIYSTDSKPKSRRGNLDADLKVGIYHHYVGSACSIVKSLNFQREDQPYLREAKIQKQGALDATQLRELYSVNLELIGNTLYKNGQYIYVDPTMVMADPTLARLLGISGYYLVTSVDHTISDSGYDVKIRALQEGIDFDENSNPLAVTFMDGGMEETPTWTPRTMTDEEVEAIGMTKGEMAIEVVGAQLAAIKEMIKKDLDFFSEGAIDRKIAQAGEEWEMLKQGKFLRPGAKAGYERLKELEKARAPGEQALDGLEDVLGTEE